MGPYKAAKGGWTFNFAQHLPRLIFEGRRQARHMLGAGNGLLLQPAYTYAYSTVLTSEMNGFKLLRALLLLAATISCTSTAPLLSSAADATGCLLPAGGTPRSWRRYAA